MSRQRQKANQQQKERSWLSAKRLEFAAAVIGLVTAALTLVYLIYSHSEPPLSVAPVGLGSAGNTINGSNIQGPIIQGDHNTQIINPTARSTEIAEATETDPRIQFLFGEWCFKLPGVVTFRKKDGFEYRFTAPESKQWGLPKVDTGFEKVKLSIVTEPDLSWQIRADMKDGSQVFYRKASDYEAYQTSSNSRGGPIYFVKCEELPEKSAEVTALR